VTQTRFSLRMTHLFFAFGRISFPFNFIFFVHRHDKLKLEYSSYFWICFWIAYCRKLRIKILVQSSQKSAVGQRSVGYRRFTLSWRWCYLPSNITSTRESCEVAKDKTFGHFPAARSIL